jgi:hypothetical protein
LDAGERLLIGRERPLCIIRTAFEQKISEGGEIGAKILEDENTARDHELIE